MEKFHKAQVAKILVLFLFLFLIPFMYSSMRPSHMYFLLNLLILVLAMDSVVPATVSDPQEDEGKPDPTADVVIADAEDNTTSCRFVPTEQLITSAVEKLEAVQEKTIHVVSVEEGEKCPSSPSLFFIGVGEEEEEEGEGESERKEVSAVLVEEEYEDKEVIVEDESCEGISSQELYSRAETFIGNFYKQLKIQREESWKSFHKLHHNNNPIEVS